MYNIATIDGVERGINKIEKGYFRGLAGIHFWLPSYFSALKLKL